MKTGLAIAMRREQMGLSQVDLAKAVGVSKATICRWESGDISNMRRDRIQKLADALNVSPISLLDEETDGLFDIDKGTPGYDEEKPPEPRLTEKQAAMIERIKNLTPDQVKQVKDYIEFLISQRDN